MSMRSPKVVSYQPAASAGGVPPWSRRSNSAQFEGPPILYYRVTVRVDGPRNTVTVTQTSLALPI